MRIPVRVMNLRRSPDRRAAMAVQLESLGIVPEFFEATDGYQMSGEQVAEMQPIGNLRYGTPLMPGQIGAAATLRALCQEISRGTHPFVCVLEDDAVLGPYFCEALEESFLSTLPSFDIFRLAHGGMMWPGFHTLIAQSEAYSIVAPLLPHALAAAQIVSRAGAARIAAGLVPLRGAPDNHLFNDGFVRGMRILQTIPPLAAPGIRLPSTVDVENKWPSVTFVGRFTTKIARLAAIFRNFGNFTQAWGFSALLRAMVNPDSSR